MVHNNAPVIIIGSGLAGLACALTLKERNQAFLIIDRASDLGGRLKSTYTKDGYLLDCGFQVLLTSYPELKHFVDLKALELQNFNSGALIYTPEKMRLLANPLIHPSQLVNETLSNLVSIKDKSLVLKLIFNLHTGSLIESTKLSTLSFLQNFGFSQDFIEIFWRPFCAGVFLDKSLEVDSDYFIFLLKNFSSGRVAVPKNGMQEIPRQMCSKIGESEIRLGVDINEISAHEVVLASGEKIKAKLVVCAFNPIVEQNSINFRSVINYYFSTEEAIDWGKWLVLIPPQYKFHINNIAVMSQVSESYSISGNHLLSVSLVGSEDPGEAIVAKELMQIAKRDLKLKLIKKYKIEKALPKFFTKEETLVKNGIYYCGDYLSSPSINGALRSGRLTAEKVLTSFKKEFSQNNNYKNKTGHTV